MTETAYTHTHTHTQRKKKQEGNRYRKVAKVSQDSKKNINNKSREEEINDNDVYATS